MSKIHFVSLGCPKNRVDAEHMLGLALEDGHSLCNDPNDADTIVVNTCSFIGEAKKESIDTILKMGQIKAQSGQKLVVTGCLAQRYGKQLESEMPEVDHFLGTSDFTQISTVLDKSPQQDASHFVALSSLTKSSERNLVTHELNYLAKYDLPRVNSMPGYTAYIKVSEGCDNACAFCIIPKLRGKQRSRTIEDIVKEAVQLAQKGVVEINLIAQDLTAYGHDIPGRPQLSDLLWALSRVDGIRWVRCMYAYPRSLKSGLMQALNSAPNILPYLDMPVQHGSDKVLRRMRRGKDQGRLTELLLSLREQVKNLVMRSTVMVGFPGETDEDFEQLVDFAKAVQFERLGVFKYSDEEDTAAFQFDDRVLYSKKRARFDRLMRIQRRIHKAKLNSLIGEVHEAIVEGVSDEHPLLIRGRLWSQAPEIDGFTYLSSTRPLSQGEIVHVRIQQAHDYDLVGEVLDEDDESIKESLPFNAQRNAAIDRAAA